MHFVWLSPTVFNWSFWNDNIPKLSLKRMWWTTIRKGEAIYECQHNNCWTPCLWDQLSSCSSLRLGFKSCKLFCRVTESGGATATCTANLEVHSCKSSFALFQSRHGSRGRTTKTQYRKFEINIPRKGIARPQSHVETAVSTFTCLWAIYIYSQSVCLFCCGPILGIYKSLTETWMWKLGLRPRNSFSGKT